jgi:hypothetical protein
MITEAQTIWFPGIYHGRSEHDWTQPVSEVEIDDIIKRVQVRAREDGEWSIENGFVGPDNENEPIMRRMMEWVADEKNIRQCIAHIYKERLEKERTIDFVCRDLANGSKWARGASA